MDDLIELIAQDYTVDELKQRIPTETAREVWGHISSVSRDEWFRAGQDGLEASLVVTTHRLNYRGERIVRVGGKQYTVYRTYAGDKSDYVELYLSERAGDAGSNA